MFLSTIVFGAAYSLSILGAFPSKSIGAAAPVALNAAGVAVGQGTIAGGATHCLVYSGAAFVDITPQALACQGGSVNASGAVVGTITYLQNSVQTQNGFEFTKGRLQIVGVSSSFLVITDAGYIFGKELDGAWGIYHKNAWTNFGGSCGLFPTGMSNRNLAVGGTDCDNWALANPYKGIYEFFGFNFPQQLGTSSVNAAGQVLMWDQSSPRQLHDAYAYENANGKLLDMGYLPGMQAPFYTPVAENDAGEVVGSTDSGVMWTWTSAKGIVNLSALVPRTPYALAPVSVDPNGRVLCAGSKAGGKTAWVLLTPPA